jgi:hypothetical protein
MQLLRSSRIFLFLFSFLFLFKQTLAYGGGYDYCGGVIGHGTEISTPSIFSLQLLDQGSVIVSSYTPGVSYTIQISGGTGGTLRGFFLAPYSSSSYSSLSSVRLGTLTAGTNARTANQCSNALTHNANPSTKSIVTGTWTAPVTGSGSVIFVARIVVDRYGNHPLVTLTIPESSSPSASSSPSPTSSPTPSNTVTPTASLSIGASSSNSPSPTSSRTPSSSPTPSSSKASISTSYLLSITLSSNLQLSWKVSNGRVFFKLQNTKNGWAGIAFNNPNAGLKMIGGDAIIIQPGSSSSKISQCILSSYSGVTFIPASSSTLDLNGLIFTPASTSSNSISVGWIAEFSRPLNITNAFSGAIAISTSEEIPLIAAWGDSLQMNTHARNAVSAGYVSITRGTFSSIKSVGDLYIAHGALMTIAWGVLVPSGIIIARYFKNNKAFNWRNTHSSIQMFAFILFLSAFFIAIAANQAIGSHFVSFHAIFGLITILLGVIQPCLGLCVGGIIHKALGYLAALFAVVEIYLGLIKLEASIGFFIAYSLLIAISLAIAVYFEFFRSEKILSSRPKSWPDHQTSTNLETKEVIALVNVHSQPSQPKSTKET